MPRRYTDTTLTFLVKNTNLSSARKVYVTISQYIPDDLSQANLNSSVYSGGSTYAKEEITVQSNSVAYSSPNTIVIIDLTQEQTARFKNGYVRCQVNWIDSTGKRKATAVKRVRHYENLHEEVLT